MPTADDLSRRDFTKLALAMAMTPTVADSTLPVNATKRRAMRWPGYADAMVIDALASPGGRGDERLAIARASGVTAVNTSVDSGRSGHGAFDGAVRRIGNWERRFTAHPDYFVKIQSVADLRAAKESGRFGVIYGFQDATALEGDLERLELFHNFGVQIVQLTYNVRNRLGDGCLEPANGGLSNFGRQVVERMNTLGMMVDLSHCGQRTTAEGIEASTQPVAITHSGCNGVYRHPRSKDDRELRRLADKGGVLGIYMMPFLNAEGPATLEHFMQHVEHAIQVCGEDHVGVGSDGNYEPGVADAAAYESVRAAAARRRREGIGAPREDEVWFIPELTGPRKMEKVADALLARGHSERRVEKIIGLNFMRLFGDVWR